MKPLYTPKLLRAAVLQIEREHTKTAKIQTDNQDDELKFLIEKILKLKPEHVASFAEVLEENQVHQICDYICHPFWFKDQPLDNLFTVIDLKAGVLDWDTILVNWENSFDRGKNPTSVREYLIKAVKTNANMIAYIDSKGILPQNMTWLEKNDFIGQVCSEASANVNEMEYGRNLVRHGISNDTLLYKLCIDQFLLYCSGFVYMNYGENRLISAFAAYKLSNRGKFIHNYFEKLDVSQIHSMKKLFNRIDNVFNEQEIKKNLSPLGFAKYQKIIKIREIEIAFDGDLERRDFWIPYAIDYNPIRYANTLCIDFGKYVVVEFIKERAAGPAYLYTKTYYEREVRRNMLYRRKEEFQKWELEMYRKSQPELCERWEHKNDWQWNISHRLRAYNIYPSKIKI